MEIGFGKAAQGHLKERLLTADGRFNVEKQGVSSLESLSVYHRLLNMSWKKFFLSICAAYFGMNLLFALLYWLCGPQSLGGEPILPQAQYFLRCFFFSVQTLATIGYGDIYPVGLTANSIVAVEALLGLLQTALFTGLFFARVSRPQPKVRFSEQALIAPYRGGPSLQFRLINLRESQLFEPRARVVFTQVLTENGVSTRQYFQLPLLLEEVLFFPLYWTVTHVIEPSSPLYGLTAADLKARNAEVLILLSATDETFSERVYVRKSYTAEEIIADAAFVNMYVDSPRGIPAVDADKLGTFKVAV